MLGPLILFCVGVLLGAAGLAGEEWKVAPAFIAAGATVLTVVVAELIAVTVASF